MNADGTGRVTVGPEDAASITWSPDGKKFLYTASTSAGSEIFRANPDGTGAVNLTNNTVSDSQASW